jgi:hypothetical protein
VKKEEVGTSEMKISKVSRYVKAFSAEAAS